MPSTFVVYGQVRGGSGTSGQALSDQGSFWVPATAMPLGPTGYALSDWTEGQVIRIAVPQVESRTMVNVVSYGADPNSGLSGFDNAPAINAAIADATYKSQVYIPEGFYYIGGPIVLNNGKCISLRGESSHTITGSINPAQTQRTHLYTSFVGDAIVSTSAFAPPAYYHDTAGGHDLWFMPGPGQGFFPYITLSYSHCGDISGSTAFCWEEFVDVPLGDGNIWALAASSGRRGNETIATAFNLLLNPSGVTGAPVAVQANITTTGSGVVTLVSVGTLSVGKHKIAVSYDGSFFRLYIDGVFNVHAAASGTIVQQPWETFLIEGQASGWPGFPAQFFGGPAGVASLRLSTTTSAVGATMAACARYTSEVSTYPFTFTEIGADQYTRWVQTFTPANTTATYSGQFALGQMGFAPGGISTAWSVYSLIMGGGNQSAGVEIRDLGIQSWAGCVLFYFTPDGLIRDMNFSGRRCITLNNNCYNTQVISCNGSAPAKSQVGSEHCWFFGATNACGNSEHRDCITKGGTYGWALQASSSTLENIYHISQGLGAVFCSNSGVNTGSFFRTDSCALSDEAGVCTDAMIYVSNTDDVQIEGGTVQNTTTPGAYNLLLDGVGALKWDTVTWTGSGSKAIKVLSVSSAIHVPQPYRIGDLAKPFDLAGTQPWTDAACPVVLHFDQTWEGINAINEIADADLVFGASTVPGTGATFNDFFWNVIQITDTHPWLTIGRNVILSTVTKGYLRIVINSTAQTLTFKGPSGTGVAVAAGKTATIRSDGTNWVRVTPDT